MAVVVSGSLLVLLLSSRVSQSFTLGPLDFVFILLPIGILGAKALLGLLSSADADPAANVDLKEFFARFFQPLVRVIRDWFPFFLLSASYYSLYSNVILRVNPHTVDGFLSRLDAALLGNQAAFLLEPWINHWVTDFLNVVYFSHVLVFPGVALYFYLRREEKAFRRIMMGFLTLQLMALASYVFLPAVGPEKYFADQFSRDLQGKILTRTVDYIISTGRVSHDCFPSVHVGIPLLVVFYLRGYRPKMLIPAVLYLALMCCATIYLRYHYVVDVLAAFVYVPVAYWLNDFLLAHWPGERQTKPMPVASTG